MATGSAGAADARRYSNGKQIIRDIYGTESGSIHMVWYTSGSRCEYETAPRGQELASAVRAFIELPGDFAPMGYSLASLDTWRNNF